MQKLILNKQVHQAMQALEIGGIYQHYKGKLYKILTVSCNADDLSWWVVYEALYDNEVSKIWHRRVEDFIKVDMWIEGQEARPRFIRINYHD